MTRLFIIREAIVQENPLQCAKTFYSLLGKTPPASINLLVMSVVKVLRIRIILRTCFGSNAIKNVHISNLMVQ
jgi:hypothetical protein